MEAVTTYSNYIKEESISEHTLRFLFARKEVHIEPNLLQNRITKLKYLQVISVLTDTKKHNIQGMSKVKVHENST